MKQENIHSTICQYGICIIIPTYNCEKTIRNIVESVLTYTSNIIVINDGSVDNTANILSLFEERITVISYPKNRGKGYALKQGFDEACKRGFSYALTIDSDGQHSVKDIPSFIEAMQQHPDALIVGARSFNHPNMPQGNVFANKFSNFWFTLQTANKFPDTQSGYRLYPLKKMKQMRPFTRRYEAELELLVRCAWKNIPILPLPIQVYYPVKEERVSHFRPKKDFIRISLLNTILCPLAIIYGYPAMLIERTKGRKDERAKGRKVQGENGSKQQATSNKQASHEEGKGRKEKPERF
ncbi:MAG: glycosyltransferase family 2 protein [Bacteroidales bacterium]|jgi:glycosyltransferase involved in cell wall biosynthesis|nr:glycosyltransferase family 2 protein [Bacteroidales bacterium]